MIDLTELRRDPEPFRASQRLRGADESLVDALLDAEARRRASLTEFERLRAEQKTFGKTVAQAKGEQKQALVVQAQELARAVKAAQAAADAARDELEALGAKFPNLVLPDVPAGGEDDFETLWEVGTKRDFAAEGITPRDHLEIGQLIGAIDMERGAKVSGSRFYFLKGAGMLLENALMNMALDQAVERGFIPMATPTLVRPATMAGTGFLGEHSDEIYHLEQDDLYLVGTSEVALAGYHADEILDLSKGPLRYAGWSTCYRREAGSHGKDTRGIIRVHQFNKLEMFSYVSAGQAQDEHKLLLDMEEEMLAKVEVPYRVINTAAGDLGTSAAQKFDSEAWIPTQGAYRELTSTSNCTTFQARRLNIRERGEDGTRPVATLNGTLATTRWLVAILENHQQPDGSVRIPEALRPYLGGRETFEVVA